MGLSTYIFLLFGISIAFFFLGSKPMLLSSLGCDTTEVESCQSGSNAGYDVLNGLSSALIQNPVALGLIGISIISSILIGGTFVIVYVFPILMLIVIANFFLLPTDFMYNEFLPFEIRMIIFGFMNLMLVLTIVSFVRGGE